MCDWDRSVAKADGDSRKPAATPAADVPPRLPISAPKKTPQRPADTLTDRWKKLRKLWKEISSPFSTLITTVSALCFLYNLYAGMGNLSFPVLGFAALSISALLLPGGAPRLFAMRVFAFAIDVLFLGVLTIAILPVLFDGDTGGPSEFAISCVVWLWFLYFFLFDWLFHGTLGKRMFGLRLVENAAEFGFLRRFLRAPITLLLPLVAGVWVGNLFTGPSGFALAASLFFKALFLLANPVSILLLGGSRGFADRAAGTEVRLGRRTLHYGNRDVEARSWVFACTLPIAAAVAIAAVGYIVGGSQFQMGLPFRIPAKPKGASLTASLSWEDPGGALKSACLAPGFRDLEDQVRSLRIDTLSSNLFRAEDTDIFVDPVDATNLAKTDGLPILRITTTSWVSPASYSIMTKNLAMCYASTLEEGKHSTAVLQFAQVDDYGLFVVVRSQFTILGVDRTGTVVTWHIADLRPKALSGFYVSSDMGGYALLWRGDIRDRYLDLY